MGLFGPQVRVELQGGDEGVCVESVGRLVVPAEE